MFRGVTHITMDAKGRLAMPAKYRDRLQQSCEGQLVATIDIQSQSLSIYPLPVWEKIEQDIQELPSLNPQVKRFQRLLIGHASDLELDGSGRVLMPQSLRDYAGLKKKLVLVGQGKKLELWNEELWLTETETWLQQAQDDESIPDEMLSLSL
ncbi:Transcriptional regulator MraZ [Sinobacterium norvegicum]|uniref:Transcriptional regulator MraZ n=1 Tax=Sinobacterium norvegicum TaxID=1641715 RepID=A0ABN8EL62_9GAMM|nr:division/cell wall cluster transcriptional repressor MraZ [Sinobacterium norvegicum]CAH0993156.1 Transcriptional regulator MraZ [Sinobacterium norvegicum]